MEKEFRKILAEISGYTEQELTDRHTEPLIQPYDCLLAMSQALTIHSVVVGSLPTDEQIDDKVDRVAASTWGDYGAGYIDGTRNGAQWVVDVVNGEDK